MKISEKIILEAGTSSVGGQKRTVKITGNDEPDGVFFNWRAPTSEFARVISPWRGGVKVQPATFDLVGVDRLRALVHCMDFVSDNRGWSEHTRSQNPGLQSPISSSASGLTKEVDNELPV